MPTAVSVTETSTDPATGHRSDVNPAPLRCERDGIRQQIQHDLLDFPLVGPHLAQSRVHHGLKRDTTSGRPLAHEGQGVLDSRG